MRDDSYFIVSVDVIVNCHVLVSEYIDSDDIVETLRPISRGQFESLEEMLIHMDMMGIQRSRIIIGFVGTESGAQEIENLKKEGILDGILFGRQTY